MNSTVERRPATTITLPRPSSAPRVDLYRAPHKGLRYLLANLLLRMGSASFEEPGDARAVIDELEAALWACDGHIEHEDRHVRPALAERAPTAIATLDAEHADHAHQVAELRALSSALAAAGTPEERRVVGDMLYLHFSVFVAETLAHMAYEERVVQPLLDRLLSIEELGAIHVAIVSSIPPPEMITFLRSMVPGANRAERAELVGSVKANAPPEAFEALMRELRPRLSPEDWADLTRRLEP